MRNIQLNRFFVLMLILLLPAVVKAETVRYKFDRSVYKDDAGAGLKQPEGVACTSDRLAVADTGNGRLILYAVEQGEPKRGREVRIPQIVYPVRVLMTLTGDLLVLDGRQRKIVRLTSDGNFKDYVDTAGAPGGTLMPAGISLDAGDNLYVFDMLGNRVVIFGDDGKFQRQVNLPKDYGFVTDIATNPKGVIFAVDSVNSLVYSNAQNAAVFEPFTRPLKGEMKFASNIAVDHKGTVYVTDQNGGGLVLAGPDGSARRLLSMGWKEGTLRYPAQVCIDNENGLFVADRGNSRIQKFVPLK